jgi:hypothetical protein
MWWWLFIFCYNNDDFDDGDDSADDNFGISCSVSKKYNIDDVGSADFDAGSDECRCGSDR